MRRFRVRPLAAVAKTPRGALPFCTVFIKCFGASCYFGDRFDRRVAFRCRRLHPDYRRVVTTCGDHLLSFGTASVIVGFVILSSDHNDPRFAPPQITPRRILDYPIYFGFVYLVQRRPHWRTWSWHPDILRSEQSQYHFFATICYDHKKICNTFFTAV